MAQLAREPECRRLGGPPPGLSEPAGLSLEKSAQPCEGARSCSGCRSLLGAAPAAGAAASDCGRTGVPLGGACCMSAGARASRRATTCCMVGRCCGLTVRQSLISARRAGGRPSGIE